MPALRVCLLFAALCVGLAVPAADPPQARASEACGKQVINEYFYTGRIKYHPQECYASALKQLDPDARMYSGIMGAIRAARARDKAADTRAATPIVEPTDGDVYDDGGGAGAGSGADPLADDSALPVDPLLDPEEPIIVDPNAEALTDESGEVIAVGSGEAALPTPTIGGQLPLAVFILMGLAGVLTLVGLGGLAVRWLDGAR